MTRQDEIKNLIVNHRRRLQVLEEKRALQGFDVKPDIILEIETISDSIEGLEQELEGLAAAAAGVHSEATPAITGQIEVQHPQPTQPRYIFISYKRHVEPDASLALYLYRTFREAGHTVFIDQTMKIGVDWASEIQRQIEACDYLLVLLSEASVHSEMVAKEVGDRQGKVRCAERRTAGLGEGEGETGQSTGWKVRPVPTPRSGGGGGDAPADCNLGGDICLGSFTASVVFADSTLPTEFVPGLP